MPTIDESVVKVSLDDSQFNKASDRTISKLDELKKSLNFGGSVESFKELDKAVKKTDFSPMEKGVEAVTVKFNALYTIADQFVRNQVNKVADSIENILRSLTIENVTEGWNKYADKTSAVQTIMAATADQFEDTGIQMEFVEGQLEKLNWFTDETSYKFLDMAKSIGKFTANEVALDDAVTAMQGISNWAAISGSGIHGASMAMYNLSQSISMGALKLQDWKSIELANMGTAEFKRVAMDAGEAAGELIKVSDGIYKTVKKGTEVTTRSFRESLAEGWLTTDVLMSTLGKYGEFTNELYKFADATEMSATPLLRYIEEYKNGTLDLEDTMTSTRMSADVLIGWLERLGSEEYDLGRRALRAAQEAKTFQETIDAVKEAVGTGWSNTFEAIFGNYEEAKQLWSDFAEGLYEVFVESGNMRNGLLRDWKKLGGRAYLIEALYDIFGKLKDAVFFFKDTFKEIFPPKTAEELVSMTEGFKNLIAALTPSENTINAVHNALVLLFTVIQKMGQIGAVIFFGLEPIWQLLGQISGMIIGLIGDISGLLGIKLDEIFSEGALIGFYNILYKISSVIAGIARFSIVELLSALGNIIKFGEDIYTTFKNGEGGIKGFIDAVIINFSNLFNTLSNGGGISGFVNNIIISVQGLFNTVASGDSVFSKVFYGIYNVASSVLMGIAGLVQFVFNSFTGENIDSNPIINFFTTIGASVQESGIIGSIGSAVTAILGFVADLLGGVEEVNGAGTELRNIISWFLSEFATVWDWFVGELTRMNFTDIVDVLILVGIMELIQAFKTFTLNLASVPSGLSGILTSIRNVIDTFSGNGLNTMTSNMAIFVSKSKYLQMAIAIGVLVSGLQKLSTIDTGKLGTAVAAIAVVMGMLAGFLKLMEKFNSSVPPQPSGDGGQGGNVFNFPGLSSILQFAIAIRLMAGAVATIGELINQDAEGVFSRNEAIISGILGLAAIMGAIAGFTAIMQNLKLDINLTKTSAALLVFAIAITALTVPIMILSTLSWNEALIGVGGLAITMLALSKALEMLLNAIDEKTTGKRITAAAIAIMSLTVGLTIMGAAIYAIGSMDIGKLIQGGIAIALMLTALVAACIAISQWGSTNAGGMLAAGAAMIAMAAAIDLLVIGMAAMALISWDSVAKGITVVVVAMLSFVAVVMTLTYSGAALGLLALGVAILSVGASFALFAVGVKTLVEATIEFVSLIAVIMGIAAVLGEDFPALVHQGFENFELIVREFLQMIPRLAGDIAGAVYALIMAIKNAAFFAAPHILNAIMIIGLEIMEIIAKWGGPLANAIARALEGLTAEMPRLMEAVGRFIEEFIAGCGVILNGALKGLVKGIFNIFGGDTGITESAIEAGRAAGNNTAKGYESGIRDGQNGVNDASRDLAQGALDSIESTAEINSPSRKTYEDGSYMGEGLANGMDDSQDEVRNSGEDLAQAALDGANKGAGTEGGTPSSRMAEVAALMGGGYMGEISNFFGPFNEAGLTTADNYISGMLTGFTEGGFKIESVMDGLNQMIFGKAAAAKDVIDDVYGFADMELDASTRKKLDNVFGDTDTSKLEKDMEKLADSMSTSFDNAVSSGSKGSSGSSKAAEKVKTEAEKIIEAYEDALNELDYLDKKHKGEYDLWSALNVDVSEMEKKTANLDYINKEIETQLKRTEISQEKYEKIAKAMGESSKEARDAEIEWLDQQVKLTELQNEMVEQQNSIIETAADQMERAEKNAELTYNLWTANNARASQMEQAQKKLEYSMLKVEYAANRATEAERAYNEALDKYGAEAEETKDLLDELTQAQIDYAEAYNQAYEDREAIAELQKQTAEAALELQSQEYEIWKKTNKQATQAEKEAKEQEDILRRHAAKMEELAEATREYQAALRKYGEGSEEVLEALKKKNQLDLDRLAIEEELVEQESAHLDFLSEELSILSKNYDLEMEYWEATNEDASEIEKLSRKRLDNRKKQEIAQKELLILEERYLKVLAEEGKESTNTKKALQEIVAKRIEIIGLMNTQKGYAEEELDIEFKNLETQIKMYENEKTRLEVTKNLWDAANNSASETEKSAQEIQYINESMVISMKEVNVLAEQYNKQIERYGENSDEALAAWKSYMEKQKEILELQNKRKEIEQQVIDLQNERRDAELDLIDDEMDMLSIMQSRASSEKSLWEALNQDVSESESKSKELAYQMKTLEFATEKLRLASKKYNYSLQMYGQDAKETQQLFNDMLDAQIEYANTYNEIKTLQLDTIEKNNEILEQLSYSEQLLDYGYNMWEKLNKDISDAQKIEAEIKKLNQDIVLQVQRTNYYGAEWKKAVAKYGESSAEAQEAYLNYLEALYDALDIQSSIADKETELTEWRAENAQKLQDAWDEVKAKDLVGGTSIYDELVEMGLSEAEIDAYVKEKAGYIEDAIGVEMDYSISSMQSKAEDALREWGLTWVDGTYEVAEEVVDTAGSCMDEMTSIIEQGAADGQAAAKTAMQEMQKIAEQGAREIEKITEDGVDEITDTTEDGMDEMVDIAEDGVDELVDTAEEGMEEIAGTITHNSSVIVDAFDGVIDEMLWWAQNSRYDDLIETGHMLVYGIGQGISINKWSVIDRIIEVVEEAIWWANHTAEISSPSRRTMWSGEMLDEGFVVGIENRAGEIAKSLSRAVQNGISAMSRVVHTSNTLDFASEMVADGIIGGIEGYSYNIVSVGKAVLKTLADEYDEMVDDAIGENQWLIDALREYGFDETTHGIEFVVNLDATDAKTQLEELFEAREADLDYYDDLIDMQEKNATKDQSDLSVLAEAQAISKELDRVLSSIASYEKEISDIVSAGRATSSDDTISAKKLEYVQNIYSTKPLSALDIYRNTNSQLLKFTTWRR